MNRIMVVDDEPHILEGLRYLLRGPDRQIDVAKSGKEALQGIAEHKPDLLITDVMMPEMSGLEVISILRGQGATRDLPIIILTAKGQKTDREKGLEAGAEDYFVKPFSPLDLIKKVEEALET